MAAEPTFAEAFKEAGGVRRQAGVSYPLTHDSIRAMCAKAEDLLRIQFEDEKFEAEDERVLATLSLDDPTQAFKRYQYVIGLRHAWERGLSGRRAPDRDTTRWQMQAREPERIRMAGREVQVTGRSRAAMIRLYRHDATRSLLGEKLDRIAVLSEAVDAACRAGEIGWWRAWLRKRRLHAVAERVEREWEHHFRGILANALTESGRAALPEEAPEWWDQVSAEDEARLFLALVEVGPGRASRGRLPPKPQSGRKQKRGREEDRSFGALLRYWEPKLHLPPMALEDVDLTQLLTALEDGMADGASSTELEDALS